MFEQKLQSILPSHSGAVKIAGLTQVEVLRALSNTILPQRMALLHLTYPAVDSRNHKSLNVLVDALSGHGMAESAALVAKQAPYLVTDDLAKALHLYHEIQKDSVAISVELYFAGEMGEKAEALIKNLVAQH